MSGLGMFAAALGGAAGAINQQATGDIEQQRKTDLMQVAAELERSKLQFAETLRQGGMRADFNFANDKDNVATRQATARSNTLAAGKDTRDAAVAMVGDETYQEAVRGQANRDASDAAARARTVVKENAGDLSYLASAKAIKLNDPEVAAHIATMRAQAAHSAASSGLIGIQTKAGKIDLDDKTKLSALYDSAAGLLSDANLTDEERAKRFAPIQRQIVLMKSKNGTGTGAAKDPELDTQTEEVTRNNPDGSTSKVTSKTVRKPGSIGADAYPEPPSEAVSRLRGDPKSAEHFDAIFGKGAAAKVLASGGAKDSSNGKGQRSDSAAPAKEPNYKLSSDGRVIDLNTGRTLTPEQKEIWDRIQSGEPTSPRDREILGR